MEKLYQRVTLPNLTKFYIPTVQARHVRRGFRRASDAENHARRLTERLERLRAAARG